LQLKAPVLPRFEPALRACGGDH